MGSPMCPYDGTPLKLKKLGVQGKRLGGLGGYNRYWVCSKCKRKWRAGQEVIMKK